MYADVLINMAGAVGLEPTVHGTKNRCLTNLATPQLVGQYLPKASGGCKAYFAKILFISFQIAMR